MKLVNIHTDNYWHYRGYLPHFENWDHIQMITYRLADSLPKRVAERLASEKDQVYGEMLYRKRIEAFLDAGYGSCCLGRLEIAELVKESFLFNNMKRYRLHAYVIMPNHVHILAEPIAPHSLSEIIKCWKSVTAREISRISGHPGHIWMKEYWDRFIRDDEHFRNALNYILENPVKAGLVTRVQDWKGSGWIQYENENGAEDKK